MNKKTQQRIVGSIAVISILFLVAPYIFSSKVPNINTEDTLPSETKRDSAFQSNSDFWDQRQENVVVHVDPIPEINIPSTEANQQGAASPVPESIWNEVTQPSNSSNQSESLASQILAESEVASANDQHNNNAPKFSQTAPKQDKLPALNLISNPQSRTSQNSKPPVQASKGSFTWFVQVGSFSNKDGAVKTLNEFRKKGYVANINEFKSANGSQKFYQVRLGPYKTRENAQRVESDLKRQNYQPIIIEIK